MNKLNERLTLIANLSVVVGIIFFAVELQQKVRRQRSWWCGRPEVTPTRRIASSSSRTFFEELRQVPRLSVLTPLGGPRGIGDISGGYRTFTEDAQRLS